jgi:hypothetical protein
MKALYTVSLYDKDNDTYLDFYETNSLEQAKEVCKATYTLIKTTYLLNRGNKTEQSPNVEWGIQLPYEQFDWVEVYSNADNKKIMVNDTQVE